MPKKTTYTCVICGEELEKGTLLVKEYSFDKPGPKVKVSLPLRTNVYQRVNSISEPWQWETEYLCETCILKTLNEGE